MIDGWSAIPNGTDPSGSQAAASTSANPSLIESASTNEETRGTVNVTSNGSGVLNETVGGAPVSQPGGNTSDRSTQGERPSWTLPLRVLEPAMGEPPQPPTTSTALSPEAQRVVGGVFGASAGALAVGLLAGLLAPMSTTPATPTWGGVEQAANATNETVVFVGDSPEAAADDVLSKWWWLAPMLLVFLLCCVMACLVRGKGQLRPATHTRKRGTAHDVGYSPLAHAPPQDDLLGEVGSLEDAAQAASSRKWQDHAEPRGAAINGPELNLLDFKNVSLPLEPMAPVHGPVWSLQQNEVPNIFDAIDTNHDGVISRAEFAEASRRAFDLHAAPGQGAPPKAAQLGPMPPLYSWPRHVGGAWTGQPAGVGALLVGPPSASSTGLFPAGAAGSGSIAGRGPSPGPSRQVSDSTRSFPGFAHGQPPAAPQAKNAMIAPKRMPSVRPPAAAAASTLTVGAAVSSAHGPGNSSVPPCPPPTVVVPRFAPAAATTTSTVPSEPVAVFSWAV